MSAESLTSPLHLLLRLFALKYSRPSRVRKSHFINSWLDIVDLCTLEFINDIKDI